MAANIFASALAFLVALLGGHHAVPVAQYATAADVPSSVVAAPGRQYLTTQDVGLEAVPFIGASARSATVASTTSPARDPDFPNTTLAQGAQGPVSALRTENNGNFVTQDQLQTALNALRSQLFTVSSTPSFSGPPATTAVNTQTLALATEIDQLSGVTISNATLNGVSGLRTSDIGGFAYATSSNVQTAFAAWGDSLTVGGQGASIPYPFQLSGLSGYYVYNGGNSGDTSSQIAARMLAALDKFGWPTIIWAGRNNYSNPMQVEADIASMVAALTTSNYIILSVLNSSTEPSGSAGYNQVIALNGALASIYGSHYLDVRSYLIAHYDPNQPQDVTDYGNDVVPSSLRSDNLHLNATGYGLVASDINQNIQLLVPASANPPLLTAASLSALFARPAYFPWTDVLSGYRQFGGTILTASSTNNSVYVGTLAGNALVPAALDNTVVGYGALQTATSSSYNTAIGRYALANTTWGNADTALGYNALLANTTGIKNTSVGYTALQNNTTGNYNVAVGAGMFYLNTTGSGNVGVGGTNTALFNTSGSDNVAIGEVAFYANTTGSNNVAIGSYALRMNGSATSSVAVGYRAGQGVGAFSSQNNVFLGYESGFKITTGSNNTLLGYQSGYNLSSGSSNIAIGYNVDVASSTSDQQLDIGNVLYGTGIYNGGSVSAVPVSAGKIAVGTTTPYSKLTVWGPDTASTSVFAVVNNASTTVFSVYDNGNATYSGSLFQSSDARLKADIAPLDASSSLAAIDALAPVSYTRLDQPDQGENLGFIAQAVQVFFPALVSMTPATALTPDGTYTLNYVGLISPIVSAIQALDNKISALAAAMSGFAQSFATETLTADNATFGQVTSQQDTTQTLCIGDSSGDTTCITKSEFDALLEKQGVSPVPDDGPAAIPPTPTTPTSSFPDTVTSTATTTIDAPSIIPDYNATTALPSVPATTTPFDSAPTRNEAP